MSGDHDASPAGFRRASDLRAGETTQQRRRASDTGSARESTERLIPLMSAALVVVLVAVSGLAVGSALYTHRSAERISHSGDLVQAYLTLHRAVAVQDLIEHAYDDDPRPALRSRFDRMTPLIFGALAELRRHGEDPDRRLAAIVANREREYVDAIHDAFDAVDAGDEERADLIDDERVNPPSRAIQVQVNLEGPRHAANLVREIDSLQVSQRTVLRGTLVAVTLGLLVLAALSSKTRVLRRRLSDATARERERVERLERAFGSQRAFISDASHELRTPITIVRGHLELLDDDPDERRATIALAIDELDRMGRFVNDLLLLARSERPDFLRIREVELGALTDELLEKAVALGPRKWTLEGRADARLCADSQRLTQAVMELAQNAVEHTAEGDAIYIGSALDGDRACLWVRDEGPGISEKDQHRVFDRFARVTDTRRSSDGAGLGLSIVRAIAEAHHGRVELRSRRGEGSRFSILLPLDHAPEPAGAVAPRSRTASS